MVDQWKTSREIGKYSSFALNITGLSFDKINNWLNNNFSSRDKTDHDVLREQHRYARKTLDLYGFMEILSPTKIMI
jgi:folate-dependent phosphoribosylglycinamide formyltransferase PurN